MPTPSQGCLARLPPVRSINIDCLFTENQPRLGGYLSSSLGSMLALSILLSRLFTPSSDLYRFLSLRFRIMGGNDARYLLIPHGAGGLLLCFFCLSPDVFVVWTSN